EPSTAVAELEVQQRYQLPEQYILYVGAIEPGKNLPMVFNVFRRICESSANKLSLVLTGGIGWKKDIILQQMPQSIQERVKILPYLTESELPILYRLSHMVLYISPYEGFGLPVLEGMACNVPVVASHGTAIKEFATGAALLIDPLDEDKIFDAVHQVLSDNSVRNGLVAAGKERARIYTWKKTSDIVLKELLTYE
ncbi:MAG: glycosyltransferase family 1 protein, partial [Bacteroidota bacterium]